MSDLTDLIEHVKKLAVVHGKVTLASGRQADYYVDLRRVTLDGVAAPVVGRVMRELVSDWDFEAAGGSRWCRPRCGCHDACRRGGG